MDALAFVCRGKEQNGLMNGQKKKKSIKTYKTETFLAVLI